MRRIFLFMMVSLDGFFEGEGHDLSWHNADNKEFEQFAHEQNNHLDTVLFGRRTYDMMASFWPGENGQKADKPTADWMSGARKVVVSEPFEPMWSNTQVISENVLHEIRKLKNEQGTDIALLGSNTLCVSLMEGGLVDEFRLMYNPIAIGKGTPLFASISKPVNLKLIDSRIFKSGNVLNRYLPL
jgi:dihydrofolate reductase